MQSKFTKRAITIGRRLVGPGIDTVIRLMAAFFILATSFNSIFKWLSTTPLEHDASTASAILMLSTALYLVVRKR